MLIVFVKLKNYKKIIFKVGKGALGLPIQLFWWSFVSWTLLAHHNLMEQGTDDDDWLVWNIEKDLIMKFSF